MKFDDFLFGWFRISLLFMIITVLSLFTSDKIMALWFAIAAAIFYVIGLLTKKKQ